MKRCLTSRFFDRTALTLISAVWRSGGCQQFDNLIDGLVGAVVLLAHALLGPRDRGMMITGEGFHPALVVGGALAQDFLAHHRNAEHLTEEVHHLLGPRQGAEVTVNDNAVEAVVNKRQEVAEQLGEYFHGKHR